jgi:hypothetical protein
MTAGRSVRELWWADQEFSPADNIPPWFSMLYRIGINSKPVGDCISEMYFHPIDIIITIIPE